VASEQAGDETCWMAPIVGDAGAGFGGPVNAFELMRAMIEAGAAGVHFEDQLAAATGAACAVPSMAAGIRLPASAVPRIRVFRIVLHSRPALGAGR
jgi:isocitrate lyase